MHGTTIIATLALLFMSTASSGPISNANQPFSFANTLFTKFAQDQSRAPSDCLPFQVPGASQSFVRCSPNARDPSFYVTLDQMKQIWALFQPWQSKETTINSRKQDFSVTIFNELRDDVPQWTIEHGKACQNKGKQGDKCLLLQFIRHDPVDQYTEIGQACDMGKFGPCYPNAECAGKVSSTDFKVCTYKYAQYHERCAQGGGFDPVCAPGLKCQFEGPFRGARGRCAGENEPLYGGTSYNKEGGKCGVAFEACASKLTCFQNTCRALAGRREFCSGGNNHKECVPGYQCKFAPTDDKIVPTDERGTCFAVKGKLSDLCEVETGCLDGLECAAGVCVQRK